MEHKEHPTKQGVTAWIRSRKRGFAASALATALTAVVIVAPGISAANAAPISGTATSTAAATANASTVPGTPASSDSSDKSSSQAGTTAASAPASSAPAASSAPSKPTQATAPKTQPTQSVKANAPPKSQKAATTSSQTMPTPSVQVTVSPHCAATFTQVQGGTQYKEVDVHTTGRNLVTHKDYTTYLYPPDLGPDALAAADDGNSGATGSIDKTVYGLGAQYADGYTSGTTYNWVVPGTDQQENPISGTFTLPANACNTSPAPVANNDTATTDENKPVTVDVLKNDTGSSLTVTSTGNPGHGSASISGNQVVYTPANGYYGADSFTYTVTDSNKATASATVSMTVKQVVVPPCQLTAKATYGGSVLHVRGVLCADGNGTTYTPDNPGKCDGQLANCLPQSEFANVVIKAGIYTELNGDFNLASPSCGPYQWDFYTGAEQKTVTSGTSNYIDGQLVNAGTCPPVQPKNPAASVEVKGCACLNGVNQDNVLTVTNTADDTKAAADYSYTLKDSSGNAVASSTIKAVADGSSGTADLGGLAAGTYSVSVTGSDQTTTTTTFTVEVCPPVLKPLTFTVTVDSCTMVGDKNQLTRAVVTNPNAVPVTGATLTLFDEEANQVGSPVAVGDIPGNGTKEVDFPGLMPGGYTLVLRVGDTVQQEQSFTLLACSTPPPPPPVKTVVTAIGYAIGGNCPTNVDTIGASAGSSKVVLTYFLSRNGSKVFVKVPAFKYVRYGYTGVIVASLKAGVKDTVFDNGKTAMVLVVDINRNNPATCPKKTTTVVKQITSNGPPPGLAYTGYNSSAPLKWAGLLVFAGTGLILIARRRRSVSAIPVKK